jgi:hypothetical protein
MNFFAIPLYQDIHYIKNFYFIINVSYFSPKFINFSFQIFKFKRY